MKLNQRINAFSRLGVSLNHYLQGTSNEVIQSMEPLNELVERASQANPWFTNENIRISLKSIAGQITIENLNTWIKKYKKIDFETEKLKKIGVVTAGNIPLVGFHDLLCVLITGNVFIGKLSSKDDVLFKFLIKLLTTIEPVFSERIILKTDFLTGFEAVIATGSDNSSRYFEYYFGKYPNIIRRNRNSIAVLTGKETGGHLQKLADDIFIYFGLGCRNVSKLFVPEGYDFTIFFPLMEHYRHVINQHKYANNYEYNKSIYLVNKVKHLDNGFLLLKEDDGFASPVSVLFCEYYRSITTLRKYLMVNQNSIQCIVTECEEFPNAIPLGKSQFPELWDYADNVDTIKFLLSL